jgi:phenylalanine-4-hydroxylase
MVNRGTHLVPTRAGSRAPREIEAPSRALLDAREPRETSSNSPATQVDVSQSSASVALEAPSWSLDNHLTWRLALSRTRELLERYRERVHPSYRVGFETLFGQSREIPSVAELNTRLSAYDWSVTLVDGYLPHDHYARLLASRTFPVAKYLRRLKDVEHSPVPDLAHDLIGHLPMLIDAQHRSLLTRLGEVMSRARADARDTRLYLAQQRAGYLRQTELCSPSMLRAADDEVRAAELELLRSPSQLARLSRLYLWTVEFGLLSGAGDEWHAYGAALLSSGREFRQLMSHRAHVMSLDENAMEHGISFCDPQRRYYVARGYADVYRMLEGLPVLTT